MFATFDGSLDGRLADLDLPPEARQQLGEEKVDLGAVEVPEGLDAELATTVERAVDEVFVSGYRVVMLMAATLALASALSAAQRQNETSKRREEEIAPGGAPVLAGRKLASWVGREATDEKAGRIGFLVHRSLGVAYGMMAVGFARVGARPLGAGIATGAAAFVLVDEGVVSTLFTPPPWAYPMESHLRGAIGHLAYGVAAGTMLASVHRLWVLSS